MPLTLSKVGESSGNKLQQLRNGHIDGILDFGNIKAPLTHGSYIVLLRLDSGVGHWVYVHNNEYFDSMGLGPPRVLGAMKYNDKQCQGTEDDYCGLCSLLYFNTIDTTY
ncbi:LOW QUALITY PROTEIN: Hypothetical protein PHPALM_234 [Phytophthora palmivora]|uniref:Uncharacterized protein n=1 Tax=Phytophthora palmivora TaxID=4796 RepID=A0A2P4YVB4_9STRA|nr:LOW QUALITY PROTEIN: Hypothetical protein PHPALM_234 [Phytophthora palmivora]